MLMYSIQKNVSTQLIVEKSKFICSLYKVQSEIQAVDIISQCKKTYWNATHNCSAYIIGEGMELQKSSDDGEPAGTAGIPMLEVLKKRKLYNVAAIVTRYFGGIKLGSGGLIHAYSKSVAQAVEVAGICQRKIFFDCSFLESADSAGKIINLLYSQSLFSVESILYEEDVTITIRIKEENIEQVIQLLEGLFSRKITFIGCEKIFLEINI